MHTLSHTYFIAKALGDIDVSFLEEAIAFPPKKSPDISSKKAGRCMLVPTDRGSQPMYDFFSSRRKSRLDR